MSGQPVECNNCGSVSVSVPKGSVWVTVALALFFIFPAIVYEVWRRTGLGACGVCGSQAVYPTNKYVDTTNLAKGMMGRIFIAVLGVLTILFLLLVGYTKAHNFYVEYKNKPYKAEFEQKKIIVVSALDSASSQDKSPDDIRKALDGLSVEGCLLTAKSQILSALPLRQEANRLKQLQTSNESVNAVITLTNQIGRHIHTAQDVLGRCEYKNI